MPNKRARPPLDRFFGTRPSQAANWRPFLNGCNTAILAQRCRRGCPRHHPPVPLTATPRRTGLGSKQSLPHCISDGRTGSFLRIHRGRRRVEDRCSSYNEQVASRRCDCRESAYSTASFGWGKASRLEAGADARASGAGKYIKLQICRIENRSHPVEENPHTWR